ncbi:MAG TPA: hypothetical protein DIU35_20115 [Candidatus Latescibacteria bacterium]|nr:hypothetical protein [Candidatus Latescibacterota bacterium]
MEIMKRPTQPSTRTITVRVYTRYQTRKVYARIHVVGETHILNGSKVELRLRSQRSGEIQERRLIKLPSSDAVAFDTRDIVSGCCVFEATLIDRHGVHFTTDVIHDKSRGKIPWLGSQEGVTSKVPKPWTPVKVTKRKSQLHVSCWGREYSFDRTAFATQISSAGKGMLVSPIRPEARVDGKAVTWKVGKLSVVGQSGSQVVLAQEFRAASGVIVFSRSEIDFDGVVRIDWGIASKEVVRLDSLSIAITLPKSLAKYLYHFPGQWGGVKNVGALPMKNLKLGFRPFIWLGDEERGLSWFAESDENRFLKDPGRATEITHQGRTVTLRINLVTEPLKLIPGEQTRRGWTGFGDDIRPLSQGGIVTDLIRYTFGLQATPVKPVTKDAWDDRIYCIGQQNEGFRDRFNVSTRHLDKLVKAGVRTVVLFEHWADAEGYVDTPHKAAVKKVVNACKVRGLNVLFYFSFLASDIAPEWEEFGKDSVILPKGGYPVFHYQPQPEQSAWRVCLNSPWQDLLTDGMAKVMKTYDLDGVYLDGTEYPFGCCNTEHGCGHIRSDGSIAQTYPIFGVRSTMRRIYEIVKSRKPKGYINVHNSTCMTMPTLGWATSYWDGEQFQGVSKRVDVDQLLPLDAFRAEFMGYQWGVPAEFLLAGSAFTFKESWSFSLLHDIPVRPHSDPKDLVLISRIWNVMDRFGRKKSEWIPYWRNEKLVKSTSKGTYCSLYRHSKNGLLAMVSNLSGKEKQVKVAFNKRALGIKNDTKALDVLSEKDIGIQKGTIQIKLGHMEWRLVWVG